MKVFEGKNRPERVQMKRQQMEETGRSVRPGFKAKQTKKVTSLHEDRPMDNFN